VFSCVTTPALIGKIYKQPQVQDVAAEKTHPRPDLKAQLTGNTSAGTNEWMKN
jgi:hypothetical protein